MCHSPSYVPPLRRSLVFSRFVVVVTAQGDLEGAIKVVALIVGKMAEDRGLSKYQASIDHISTLKSIRMNYIHTHSLGKIERNTLTPRCRGIASHAYIYCIIYKGFGGLRHPAQWIEFQDMRDGAVVRDIFRFRYITILWIQNR